MRVSAIIPAWHAQGVLPPIDPLDPTGSARPPYEVSLGDLALHFDTSPERRVILLGLLDFRAALHRLGLQEGFQWLDGSFLENIEQLEGRPLRHH